MTMREPKPAGAESLSALMDGELSAAEQARILERLGADPALQRRWARYHAARAALTAGAGRLSPDFAERVGRACADEPAVLAPGRARRPAPAWLRPVAGVAIAASVALVAIGGLTLLRGPAIDGPPVTVAGDAPGGLAGGGEIDTGAVAPVSISTVSGASDAERARARQRLMLYLASHSEYADSGEMPTMIPYGRLSSLNAGQ